MAATKTKTSSFRHLDGCPSLEERVESYPARRPSGETLEITRCLDCGASSSSSGGSELDEGGD